MYVSRVSLRHVRSFRELDLDLTKQSKSGRHAPRLRTILIGENGTGKTTFLRALAVALADRDDASGLLAEDIGQLVAGGEPQATITIDLQPKRGETKTCTTVIEDEHGQDTLGSKEPTLPANYLVCGYGISRANETSERVRKYRIVDSVYNLFEYQSTLTSTELTLRRLRDFLGLKWYDHVLNNIKTALGLDDEVMIDLPPGGGIRISGTNIGRNIPLAGWADGYRKTLSWILDIYAWALRAGCITKTGAINGIVLIDEIEQHLHPSMQVNLFSRLSKLLPHVQIIATTHSPLVALGVAPEELVVLKRQGGNVVAQESITDFRGYSVEDMVSDPKLFDSDTYTPEVTEKLERYRMLAGKSESKRSLKEQNDLKKLASELAAQEIPEFRENPALVKLQKILKKHNL